MDTLDWCGGGGGGGGGSRDAEVDMIPQESPQGERYKTWSLFLACSPRWLANNSQAEMIELYEQFARFGRAIGPGDVAVWFTKSSLDGSKATPQLLVTDYDSGRAARFCKRYRLSAREAPHVLVTTEYPDLKSVADFASISLGNADAKVALTLLTALNDQIFDEKINQRQLDKAAFWASFDQAARKWWEVATLAASHLGKMRLRIKALGIEFQLDSQPRSNRKHAAT
jgi:hypothetical protein